jgi:hypothetical protein
MRGVCFCSCDDANNYFAMLKTAEESHDQLMLIEDSSLQVSLVTVAAVVHVWGAIAHVG